MYYWQSKHNEIDFVTRDSEFVEVKQGAASPFDFSWFAPSYPREKLMLVNQKRFSASAIEGMTLEDFLSAGQ